MNIIDESEITKSIVVNQRAYDVPKDVATELTKLKSDVERLRIALEPFAAVVEVINKNAMCDGGPIPDESFLLAHWEWNTSSDITIGDCRNAARALDETKKT